MTGIYLLKLYYNWHQYAVAVGLKQFEFQLAEEPELGVYKITAERGGAQETATFKVEEYGKVMMRATLIFLVIISNYHVQLEYM